MVVEWNREISSDRGVKYVVIVLTNITWVAGQHRGRETGDHYPVLYTTIDYTISRVTMV